MREIRGCGGLEQLADKWSRTGWENMNFPLCCLRTTLLPVAAADHTQLAYNCCSAEKPLQCTVHCCFTQLVLLQIICTQLESCSAENHCCCLWPPLQRPAGNYCMIQDHQQAIIQTRQATCVFFCDLHARQYRLPDSSNTSVMCVHFLHMMR